MEERSNPEDVYIKRMEIERQQKKEIQSRANMEEAEKQKLKALHSMNCPKCGLRLIEIEYEHVLVDKCTGCEGIFLDAGDLETIIDLEKSSLDKFFSVFRK